MLWGGAGGNSLVTCPAAPFDLRMGCYVPGSGRRKEGGMLFCFVFFHVVSALLYFTWLYGTSLSYGMDNIFVKLHTINE